MCSSSSSHRSQEVVRDPLKSKFLMRLGVVHHCDPLPSKHLSLADASSESSLLRRKLPTRDLQSVPRYTSQLKYNHHEEKRRLERRMHLLRAAESANPNSPSPTTLSKMSKPKRCITFDESVKVVPIPMRSEYSDRIRSRLWSNTVELYENAARNHVEYASENFDWRNAADDEQMYICSTTGEKIHPVHYEMMSHSLLDGQNDRLPFLSPAAENRYWSTQDII